VISCVLVMMLMLCSVLAQDQRVAAPTLSLPLPSLPDFALASEFLLADSVSFPPTRFSQRLRFLTFRCLALIRCSSLAC